MSLFDKEVANERNRLIQILSNKQKNQTRLSNLINIEIRSPNVKQRSSCNEQSERQSTETRVDNANRISKRKETRRPKPNTARKIDYVQEKNDTTTPKTTIRPSTFKKNTQKQTNTRIQTPVARTDAKENMEVPELENRTSECEPVSKKSKVHISSCFVSIGDINVNTRKSFLPGYHHTIHDTSNSGQSSKNDSEQSKAPLVIKKPRKHRSQSVSCATLKPRLRPKLRAKSLTHLSDIETLSGFKIDDCVKRIKKWRLKPIPLQNLSAKHHLKLDDHCIKRAKKRRGVSGCSVDSSDKKSGPTNPKQVKTESIKNHKHDKERETKSPNNQLKYDQKVVRPSTRKEMLLLLFGEDSETEVESSPRSYAGTTPSKKASECNRGCVKNTFVEGGKKPRKEQAKPTKPAETRPKVSVRPKAVRNIVLADLFPDPTEAFEKVVKSGANKHSSKSQKPPYQKSTKLKLPQQESKKKMKPSLVPNATINLPDKASCTSKPKTASKSDIKLTSPKVVAKPFPEPSMATQEAELAKFESCLSLSLSVAPAKQKAKIVHEEELCTETYTINAVDVHFMLKNEVVVKEEELTDYRVTFNSQHLHRANNGEAGVLKVEDIERIAVKSETLNKHSETEALANSRMGQNKDSDQWNNCVKHSLGYIQKCFVSFETTRPLSPIPWPVKEKSKSNVEEQRCTEKCNVSGIATVKNDSQVVKNAAKSADEFITLYSCAENTSDGEVQIVSVTVPASSMPTKKNASASNPTNVLSFSIDMKSLGTAEITCPGSSSEHEHVGSVPSKVRELQRKIEVPPIRGATSVTVPQSCSIEPSSVQMKSDLSIRDRKFIETTLFNHVYFLMHLFNAQNAYLSCLEKQRYCKNYFQWERQMFEKDKNNRIQSQSMQMCSELLQLSIRSSINLPATAEGIVHNLTKQLNRTDTPKRVTKSMVYLCVWTLMSAQYELYASVPLFKVILRHCEMVVSKVTTKSSVPFPLQMRQTLIEQIQQYNVLVETSARMATQTTTGSILPLYLPTRLGNANSSQRPAQASETQRCEVLRNELVKPPHPRNSAISERAAAHGMSPMRNHALPSVPTQVTLATSQSPNGSNEMPRVANFALPINDNFKIKLPYSRPVTSVATGSSPIMSTAPSRVATPQSDADANGNPDQPVQRPVLVQGIAALRSIGRAADMLAYHGTAQELVELAVDTPTASPSHTSKFISLQQEKPGSRSPLTCAVDPSLQKEQRQPTEDTCSEDRSRRPSSASTGDVETIDLTWLDDMDEGELKEEMDYACVKTAINEECHQMAPKEGEEEVTYTVVYDTNLCICDEPPKYSCHCGQAWYCGKACQLKDWSSHRYICHLVLETEKTELPLPFAERPPEPE